MSPPTTNSRPRHSLWQDLLQIIGAATIVAFHVRAPFSQAGWVAVELFFAIAGMRMASALDRDGSAVSYAISRTRRLFPEVAAVWVAVLLAVVLGRGTTGMLWFLGSAPLHLQNLTPLFFRYDLPKDAVFGPLWFVGVLMQLQILIFLLRRWIVAVKPELVIAVALFAGVALRAAFSLAIEHHIRGLDGTHAGVLYCMPFCHLEAMVLGVLVQRGAFPWLGRTMALWLLAVVAAGLLHIRLSSGQLGFTSLGYDFPLRFNFSHLWGYPLLAVASASIAAANNPLARRVDAFRASKWIGSIVTRLSALTFGVYCFHGLIISVGINGSAYFGESAVQRTALFVVTLVEAFALSAAFSWIRGMIGSGKQAISGKS